MAITYSDRDKIAGSNKFLARLKQALSEYAEDVLSEAATIGYHTDRLALANRVLSDPGHMTQILAVTLLADDLLSGGATARVGTDVNTWDTDATDANLDTVINARWNYLFGVS